MYLTPYDRISLLLESISRLETLVDDALLTAGAAYHVIVAEAKVHQDWPKDPTPPAEVEVPPSPIVPLTAPINAEELF